MNSKSLDQSKSLVKASYINQGEQALNARRKLVTALISNRKLPPRGWDDAQIELLLGELAMMDSNNFVENVGVGEREGRVYCSLVARRHYRLSHGLGRSGDVAEVQPKAAGSSLLAKLCHVLALDAVRIAGISNARAALVIPMATGMSLALTFTTLRNTKPAAKFIVWTRMDQKSCFKAIAAAGFTPVVVENLVEGDAVVTDVAAVRAAVDRCGAENVLCVVTTTSCFAPRVPDKVDEVARACSVAGVGHVINNAYGVQCSRTCRLINRAMAVGRVDAVLQSTDKNFMVPVGGAVACGPDPAFIEQIGKSYAGRASASPCLDLLMTLLSMGGDGWRRLLREREDLVGQFRQKLNDVAERNGERLLNTDMNTISFAMTLDQVADKGSNDSGGVAFLGSMLFTRCVSGTRVVPRGQKKTVAGVDFTGYGASVDGYPHDYMTAACALGLSEAELDEFVVRLNKAMRKVRGEPKVSSTVEGRSVLNPMSGEVDYVAGRVVTAGTGLYENGKARVGGSDLNTVPDSENQARGQITKTDGRESVQVDKCLSSEAAEARGGAPIGRGELDGRGRGVDDSCIVGGVRGARGSCQGNFESCDGASVVPVEGGVSDGDVKAEQADVCDWDGVD